MLQIGMLYAMNVKKRKRYLIALQTTGLDSYKMDNKECLEAKKPVIAQYVIPELVFKT